MTQVVRGSSIRLYRRLPGGIHNLAAPFRLTCFRAGYWLFHGPEEIFLNKTVASSGAWRVRVRRWNASIVEDYWTQHATLWQPFSQYCESQSLTGTLDVDLDELAFTWQSFPYTFRALGDWDTTPPTQEVVARFDELCARLES